MRVGNSNLWSGKKVNSSCKSLPCLRICHGFLLTTGLAVFNSSLSTLRPLCSSLPFPVQSQLTALCLHQMLYPSKTHPTLIACVFPWWKCPTIQTYPAQASFLLDHPLWVHLTLIRTVSEIRHPQRLLVECESVQTEKKMIKSLINDHIPQSSQRTNKKIWKAIHPW